MDYTDRQHSGTVLLTVVETPEFIRSTRHLMSEAEREALITFLSERPAAGDLIPGTGGVRKLRWQLEGRGKRGGARVIYYFYNLTMPLFALTAFAKNERVDLSRAEHNELRQLCKLLVETYRGARR